MQEALKDEVTQGQDGAATPAEDGEKRASRRLRTLKGGQIAWSGQFCTADCMVKDMSESGARLIVRNAPLASHGLVLHVPMDGFSVACERVWARGEIWGVRFTGPKASTRLARHQVVRATLSGPAMVDAHPAHGDDDDTPPRPGRAFGKRR